MYSTRVVNPDGSPATGLYGLVISGGAIRLGSGNPGDEGKQLGVNLTIKGTGQGNKYATLFVTPAK